MSKSSDEVKATIKLLKRSDDLPGDVIVASGDIDKKTVSKIRQAIMSARQEFVDAICTGVDNKKYLGMTLTDDVSDKDYDSIREMFDLADMTNLLKSKR